MTDTATKLLLALATREVTYDLGELHADHAWLEGDVVHVATVERVGMVRRQHVVQLDVDDDVAPPKEERVTVCAECKNEVYLFAAAPGVEWREDRFGKAYADGCATCCAYLEGAREVA